MVLINGVDVTNYTHREVVRFIKSCRDRQSELELTVKPNREFRPSLLTSRLLSRCCCKDTVHFVARDIGAKDIDFPCGKYVFT